MALSITVTKKSVIEVQNGLFAITLNMQYRNDLTVLIDRDFTQNHWVGQLSSLVVNRFKDSMQKAIDACKTEQAIYDAPSFDTAITNLKNSLNV